MNNARRTAISGLMEMLQDLLSDLEVIKDHEEETLDNIPENLQGTERYLICESAVDNLNGAYDSIQEALEYLEASRS